VRLDVVPSSPGVFTTNAAGFGQAAAFNQDLSPNSPGNPAARGTIITFFATGEGETTPPGVDGRIMPRGDSPLTLPMPALPVIVGVANRGAEVLYAGAVPGQVAGLLQINARIPDDAPTGPGVPLLIKAGDAFSQPGVTLAIR